MPLCGERQRSDFRARLQVLTDIRAHTVSTPNERAKRRRDRLRVLSAVERASNYAQRSSRSVIEHLNQNTMRRHGAFKHNDLYHALDTITDMVYCCTYAEAVKSTLHPPRRAFGWWPHNLTDDAFDQWREHIDKALVTADVGYDFEEYCGFFTENAPTPAKRRRHTLNDDR